MKRGAVQSSLCLQGTDGFDLLYVTWSPSPGTWDPALLSLMCWVEVEVLHSKQSSQVKRKKQQWKGEVLHQDPGFNNGEKG